MTFEIKRFSVGRAGIVGDVILQNLDVSKGTVGLSGVIDDPDVEFAAEQFAAYVDSADETFVPVRFVGPTAWDGFYRVADVRASASPSKLLGLSVSLERVRGFAAPIFESVVLGSKRATSGAGVTPLAWHGVPATAVGYETGVLTPTRSVLPSETGDVQIFSEATNHLFNARQLLLFAELKRHATAPLSLILCQMINTSARLTRWTIGDGPGRSGGTKQVFDNQALNVLYNYGCRASVYLLDSMNSKVGGSELPVGSQLEQRCLPAVEVSSNCDIFITDPPYADAVNYHEITEFFIAWLRKNPPKPFATWTWDSRRALAIKGNGDDFRRGMIDAYKAMADHMPVNGLQCVMFTHQDTGVWSDMVGIFWAAGLQVISAWYIATETTSELKKGGYVQGTVTLMLRKRPDGDRPGSPWVRIVVASIES